MLSLASAIGRAMDPDTGGALSFDTLRATDAFDVTWVLCDTPCTGEFAQQAQVLLATPAMLYQVIFSDYASRWPELASPTLEDCQQFCASARVVVRQFIDLESDELFLSLGLRDLRNEAL